jgi:excinuclease UvrABC helicase subunit UvrB
MFERLAEALRRAIENKVISDDDFYTTDFEVWDKLKASGDEYILRSISDIENIKTLKMCLDTENYDYYLQGKFRPIDPPVLFNNVLRRATDIFPELAKTIAFERERFNKGFYLRVVRG